MFGRLAQTYTVLIQPLTNVEARQFLTWYGCSNREESTDTCLQPFWLNTRRVLWLMEHRDWRPWKEHKEWGSKEMDHCASKGNSALALFRSLSHLPVPTQGLYAASTTQRKVCMLWYTISLQNEAEFGKSLTHFPVIPVYCWFSITPLLDAPEKPQELPFLWGFVTFASKWN